MGFLVDDWRRAMVECHVSRVMGIVGFARGWFGHLKLEMCWKML